MALEGLHHITAITGDAPRNVDFYARVLGLRLVKKTVNFDQPDVYHLYFGDERGTPGSILTFFEFPGATPGQAGDGMVHTIRWRVAAPAALDFWADRLRHGRRGGRAHRRRARLRRLRGAAPRARPRRRRRPAARRAGSPTSPPSTRCWASTACAPTQPGPRPARAAARGPGFSAGDDGSWTLAGEERHGRARLRGATRARHARARGRSTTSPGRPRTTPSSRRTAAARRRPARHATPIIDRQYFHSVYFREPSGVLFELASRDIGFDYDEPVDELGQEPQAPAAVREPCAPELERRLTPLSNPRQGAAA